MTSQTDPLFDATIRVDRIPAAGRSLDVQLDEEALSALAASLRVSVVERFSATLTVVPFRGGIRAQGRLSARVVQPSVVSFKPVPQDIDEPVDRIFLPDAPHHRPVPGQEVLVDLDDEDFPDRIEGPEVDLSALLIEVLALAIDPYPKLPGETVADLGLNLDGEGAGPFAALSKLKKSPDV